MVLVVENRETGKWTGEFAIGGQKGPHSEQAGFFRGTASGNQVEATCETPDGGTFKIEGTVASDNSLALTRSDIPGSALAFRAVAPLPAGNTRGDASFLLTTGGTNGRVTVSTSPSSVTVSGSTTISEHRGTWQGVPVIFWAYSSGTANLTIYIDPMCVSSQVFATYRFADFSTKTVVAGNGQMTMYSSVTRTQIKYKVTPTASP